MKNEEQKWLTELTNLLVKQSVFHITEENINLSPHTLHHLEYSATNKREWIQLRKMSSGKLCATAIETRAKEKSIGDVTFMYQTWVLLDLLKI